MGHTLLDRTLVPCDGNPCQLHKGAGAAVGAEAAASILTVQPLFSPCLAFSRLSQRVMAPLGHQTVSHTSRTEEDEWVPYLQWSSAAPGVFKG